jgi:hypothetical protein
VVCLANDIKTKCLRWLGSVGSPRTDSRSGGGSYILCGHGYCSAGRILLVCAIIDDGWMGGWGVGVKCVDV